MALKAIVYKANVSFSDLDRNVYVDHVLTVARHPSETEERLMVRLLAFVLNAPADHDHGSLEFGKDMWEPDEPALSQHDLTGLLVHWIELGQPEERRLMRACGRAKQVTVYSYGSTTPAWWASMKDRFSRVHNLTVWQIPPAQSQALGALASRSMDVQVTLQDGGMWVGVGDSSVEVNLVRLFGHDEA
jgi:uncharacterized protein YaeQ